MPPTNKGKGKARETKRSPSRNTTPSSRISASPALSAPPPACYLDNDATKILVPSTSQYNDVLERVGSGGPIPEQKSLQSLVEHLKTLSQAAEARGDACNAGMRELAQRKKEVHDDRRSQDQVDRVSPEDRLKMKREVDDDDEDTRVTKGGKVKKRKDRGVPKEERPLTHGAHGVSRQDGTSSKAEGSRLNQKRTGKARATSPSPKKAKNTATGSMSSLSPTSPTTPTGVGEQGTAAGSPSGDSQGSHQPEPAPAIPQYQVFGPDPLKFDDPTIYHIREVTPGMTDEERKEIYSVEHFPSSDLGHMMAGTPPDKDFSTAKPTNQVAANTFASYIEPYVRPLTEEDIAFLKEKGDRSTPFLMPRRGKKHYTEIWAEEDGSMNIDSNNQEKLPLNQGRGNIDQVTDETTESDQVSVGPLVGRLHSLLRFEHRGTTDETATAGTTSGEPTTNGMLNGDAIGMDVDQVNGETEAKPLPSATTFTDPSPNGFKVPAAKLEHAQLDERLKAELRYVGFLGEENNPDYDAHYDDDIAERLRLLQTELKKQMITNGARKTRLLEIARERMAYQEYSTIRDDLDSQVQQAYLKRTRTLGKSKKGSQAKHRPGGAGGGSHPVGGNAGVSRPGIGDVARTLMDRRKRWADCIGPIFKDSRTSVPPKEESTFDPAVMEEYEKAEVENWDEEQE